ncbi:MAG: DUF2029 domain-containing protein [Saprospiraceae bacterium]|nr:DUF2029 domain-containing protein [Saprospiraceae bacterium]
MAAFGAMFGLYLWVVFASQNASPDGVRWYVGLGIVMRVFLLFNIPNLSDDFYRFLWDGYLTLAGIHPFSHPPIYFFENRIFPPDITPELYARLNSPEYFTVYPPVCQAVFALAAWGSLGNLWGGVVLMKVFLLACEIGTIGLLGSAFGKSPASWAWSPALLYALNPLVILEIVGNCHFEGAMVFFLLAGLRALRQDEVKRAAVWWGLATAAKLLPLMFLPIVWRWLGWRRGRVFVVVFVGSVVVLFAPLWSVLPNILSSLDLYFRQFQFNASFYHVFRSVGNWWKGYETGRWVGPMLGLATVVGVLATAWLTPRFRSSKGHSVEGLCQALLIALVLHLFFSAIVHPWYVAVPFAMGLLTRWRFPLVWSGLVVLSYSHYAGGFFRENYWLIALEYLAVWLFLFWEIKHRYSQRKSASSASLGRASP